MGEFRAFQEQMLANIAASLGVPYEHLTADWRALGRGWVDPVRDRLPELLARCEANRQRIAAFEARRPDIVERLEQRRMEDLVRRQLALLKAYRLQELAARMVREALS